MVLHTINASPSNAAFSQCLAVAKAEDAIILMGDGVYGVISQCNAGQALRRCTAEIYALDKDMRAAGIKHTPEQVTLIDMDGFVQLSERYVRQLAWY